MSTDELTLSDYQARALETAIYPEQGDNLTYPVLGLNGEAGELAEKLKKVIRGDGELDEGVKSDLRRELGDVLWYVAVCAHELDVDLSDVASENLEKLKDRKERDVIAGEGDNR